MKPIRFALGAIAIAFAATATAAPTPSTYSFSTPTTTSHTAVNTAAGWNATTGTNWGNSLTFTSTGTAIPVTVTAWASTGGNGGYGGTLQTAALTRYGTNELAITSRSAVNASGTSMSSVSTSGNTQTSDNAAVNAELMGWNPNTNDNQHAIDNAGGYESLMFSFASAVTLKDVSIGFPSASSGLDSDATVLAYTGTNCSMSCADPTALASSARTYDQLLQSGWTIAGNMSNMSTSGANATGATVWWGDWSVRAYMAIGTNSSAKLNDGKDFIKVSGLTAVRAVPEPSSIALFGIAAAGLLVGRRRKVRKA